MICWVGICTDLEQDTDEGEGAVVNRILKAMSYGLEHGSIGHAIRFIDGGP